ncbi:type II CAAX endopeptidase family protein [uncultured Roseovarius sp.]|uniref:CPBP family intramembrane glutamic endopeptidase n=1 Tax=uncultured Roseovarius sp. TaxID=293344 RepID=UPI00262B20B7|nr:type II CAAX endopeptidase family protein [uncultured Roseovarius sp.]
MRYDPHEILVSPARPSASLHLLLAGMILTILVCWGLNYFFWMVVFALLPNELSTSLTATLENARTPGGVVISLCLFALLSVALAVSLRILHQRGVMSLIGPLPLALYQFRRVIFALVLLFAVTSFLPLPDGLTPTENLDFGRWLGLLPLALFGLLIQTSAEELAFRGYLQSQLAAQFRHPLIWIGVPSLLFGLLHYDSSLPSTNALIIVLWATFFGLAAADLTARSGTLGPAIALHMVNNFSAIAFAAPEGAFDGLALYTFPFSLASSDALITWAPIDLLLLLCSWLTARLALRR